MTTSNHFVYREVVRMKEIRILCVYDGYIISAALVVFIGHPVEQESQRENS